jgi:plastocyanin
MQRWGIGLAVALWFGAPPPAARAQVAGVRLTGHVIILDKDNKPAGDVGDAVIYLEGPGPQARAVTAEVAISDKVYVPHVMVVPVGSTVRFPNHDPFNHNVFSVSEPNGFDLGLYGRGEAKTKTFTAPGLVRVFCNVHPRMVAYIVVLGNRWYTQPAGDGAFAIPDVPPGRYRLHVWHERVAAEVVKDVVVGAQGAAEVQVALNARGYKWQPHKNKYGRDYPTNAGRERY